MSIFYMMGVRLEKVMKRGPNKVLSERFFISRTHYPKDGETGALKYLKLHFQDREEEDHTSHIVCMEEATARDLWQTLHQYFAATETMLEHVDRLIYTGRADEITEGMVAQVDAELGDKNREAMGIMTKIEQAQLPLEERDRAYKGLPLVKSIEEKYQAEQG